MTAGPSDPKPASPQASAPAKALTDRGQGALVALISLTACVLAYALCYWAGLGGQYVPTNGDEMVYAHIARLTLESHQWLPLVSDLGAMRNTKPPLLFWQAMVAGGAEGGWTLWNLRLPSLIYTLLTAAGVAWTLKAVTRSWATGLLAACIFLAFLSTFRYGRPYLTSAPETFWLSLPLFALLWAHQNHNPSQSEPRLQSPWVHSMLGLTLGFGLAYKSFALVAPVAAAWWLAGMALAARSWGTTGAAWAFKFTLRVGWSALLALGVFGLWLVLDPDPQAVWNEFIIGENAGKFSDAKGYWAEALSLGGSSFWSQLLAYPFNAGLLGAVVLGAAALGLRQLNPVPKQQGFKTWAASLSSVHVALMMWLLVWLLVFMVPSQRTARYVMPAMPALAMLLALHWHHIGRGWFVPGLWFGVLGAVLLGVVAWSGFGLGLYSPIDLALVWALCAALLGLALWGTLRAPHTRTALLLSPLCLYLGYHFCAAPMDGPAGTYTSLNSTSLNSAGLIFATRPISPELPMLPGPPGPPAPPLTHLKLAVPSNFNGQFERYEFLLAPQFPGVALSWKPYEAGHPENDLNQLLQTSDAVVWVDASTVDTANAKTQAAPPCLPNCQVLAQRWIWKSRHQAADITWRNLLRPEEWLFKQEWLLTRASS